MSASRVDSALAAFKTRLLAAGKPKKAAILATARKLLTILNAIMKTRQARHLTRLTTTVAPGAKGSLLFWIHSPETFPRTKCWCLLAEGMAGDLETLETLEDGADRGFGCGRVSVHRGRVGQAQPCSGANHRNLDWEVALGHREMGMTY